MLSISTQQPPMPGTPGQPQVVYVQAPKKRRIWPWVLLGILILTIGGCTAMLAAGTKAVSDAVASASQSLNTERTVTYKVTVSGPAEVSFWKNGSSSEKIQKGDWSTEIKATPLDALSVTVMASDLLDDSFESTCEILVDGKSISKNTGKGSAFASCSGSVTAADK